MRRLDRPAAIDDRQLVARRPGRATAERARRPLLRRHYDRVHAVCRRIAGSSRDADDAAQEAMISIVRGLPRFDGRAAVLDLGLPHRHQRRPRRAAPAPAPPVAARRRRRGRAARASSTRSPSAASTAIVDRLAIDAALDELPEDFRAAVVLRDVADLDYAEIAEVARRPGRHREVAHRPRPSASWPNRSGTGTGRTSERPTDALHPRRHDRSP